MRISRSKQFDKQYKKLSTKIQKQFAVRLKLYLKDNNNNLLNVHCLKGEFKGLWSFNVSGDVRVVFDKSYNDVVILVAIGSHSDLYS